MDRDNLVISAIQVLLVSFVVLFSAYAISVYLLPRPLTFILAKGWEVALALVTVLPQSLQQLLPALQSSCANSPAAPCVNAITTAMLAAWNAFISSIFQSLDISSFPLVDAILMTAVWLGLANVSNWTNIGHRLIAVADGVSATLVSRYKEISPTSRTNIFFFAILALGSFLCFSSIIAIPSLQETETRDQLKPEELKSRLKAVALAPDMFKNAFPKPVTSLNLTLSPVSDSPQADATGMRQDSRNNDEGQKALQLSVATLARTWSRTIDQLNGQWADLRDAFNSSQNKMIDIATQTFDLSNRGRKGMRETQQHFLAIELWYRRWWAQRETQLNQCRVAIERYASEAQGVLDTIGPISTLPGAASSIASGAINDALKRFNQSESAARSMCSASSEVQVIPDREDFGGYLGIFGIATRWLLKTESLSLVLITGLLGFGLLGAACSTFIRNVRVRSAGEPLVPNLASVVIRGGSAAVLIFLAVYGGLAVFASTATNPFHT
jgi:hypothetical protein